MQRDVLPMPDRLPDGLITYDAKDPDTSFSPIEPLRPPARAPNVLVILLDDVGFGASSAFGGPCATPTAERLAANGLKYNRFHTTALCAPTRQALLTGRNHHSVGMGGITSGRDALELVASGAASVALGTILFADPGAPARIRAELASEIANLGVGEIDNAIGLAHAESVAISKTVARAAAMSVQ